jgi:hypothetical protein
LVFGVYGIVGGRAPARGAGAGREVSDLAGDRKVLGLRAALDGERGDCSDRDERRGEMKFADGRRTLEQTIASLLKHQRHQVD